MHPMAGPHSIHVEPVPAREAAVALRHAWLWVSLIPIGYAASIFFFLTIWEASGYGLFDAPGWFGWFGLVVMLFGCLGPFTSVLAYARTATRGDRAGSGPMAAGVVMVVGCLTVTVAALSNTWVVGV